LNVTNFKIIESLYNSKLQDFNGLIKTHVSYSEQQQLTKNKKIERYQHLIGTSWKRRNIKSKQIT
jgi:hypothetical protein